MNKVKTYILAGLAAASMPHAAAMAESLSPSMAYGYKTYFQHHPPKETRVKLNLYPFPTPIIRDGQDIPVCAAARTAGAYTKKKEMRYLSHGKNGWLFRTVDFKTDFSASPKAIEYFTRLNKTLERRGQTLVAAFQPPRGMMSQKFIDLADKPAGYAPEKAKEGYKAFLKQLGETGIVTADLSDVPENVTYFPKGDFHWTPEGARDSAGKLAETIRKLPVYKDLKKQDFESKIVGMGNGDRGVFEEFIQNTCHVNIELTTEPTWVSSAKGSAAADAASLLDDASYPAVTLLGTSNSSKEDKFNFPGFLKEFLRTDIYNASITAGGFDESPIRYLASDEYHDHPPKVVIWEFLPQHEYNSAASLNAFRQMIPAVHGACSEKKALMNYTGTITQVQTDLFSSIRNQPLKDTYLYLEVSDPKERELKVEVLYASGNADQVDLTRSTRAANNGKYYLELGDKAENKALLMHVVTNVPQGQMTARLCQYPVQLAEK